MKALRCAGGSGPTSRPCHGCGRNWNTGVVRCDFLLAMSAALHGTRPAGAEAYTGRVNRFAIALVALLIAVAAPARAWCEATCLSPATETSSTHCPSHDTSNKTALNADASECPALEVAQPSP